MLCSVSLLLEAAGSWQCCGSQLPAPALPVMSSGSFVSEPGGFSCCSRLVCDFWQVFLAVPRVVCLLQLGWQPRGQLGGSF